MATEEYKPPILLSIDLQQGMVEGDPSGPGWGPRSTPNLTTNVAYLLKTWRAKGWPIIHVQHDASEEPDNPIRADRPETFKIHASAAPQGDEKVFVKHTGSAFMLPELADSVKGMGKRKIVVMGMDGGQCVNSSTRTGVDLGYWMMVAADACASYAPTDYEGKQVDAQTAHDHAMWLMGGDARIVMTKDVLKKLGCE